MRKPHEQLERLRRTLGLTHRELGQAIGCKRPMATLLCHGKRRPSLDLAARIERASSQWGEPIRCAEWAERTERADWVSPEELAA